MENLRKSFPEKSETEINAICKNFYQNFADYIVETLKTFTVSNNELRVRVQHINQHLFSEALEERKNIIMLSGHIFNWEWFNALAEVVPQKYCFPVYRKMQSAFGKKKLNSLEVVLVIQH